MPEWEQEIRGRLASLQLAPAREAAIVEELSQHLDDCYAESLAGGATEDEAYRVALAELSDQQLLVRELRYVEQQAPSEYVVFGADRRTKRTNMIADLWQDLRFGARMLVKNPGFTLIAILTLAFGIGANTAIFSVVNGVLLRPLEFKDPDRLVIVRTHDAREIGGGLSGTSMPDFREWRARNNVFEGLAAVSIDNFNLTGEGYPEQVNGGRVTTNTFRLFGVEPRLGRTFTSAEEQWGEHRVVMLSHGLWESRFAADPGAVGKTMSINGEPYTIMGVMPKNFDLDRDPRTDLWVPLAFEPGSSWNTRANYYLAVIGRMKQSVTLAQAQREMDRVSSQLAGEPEGDKRISARVDPLHELAVSGVSQGLLALLVAVGCVLLIACANIANLLLARAAARQKEMAVRAALGARRGRMIRQLLAESLLLGAIGGAFGLLLAYWGQGSLIALAPAGLPRLNYIRVDGQVLAFTLGVSFLTSLLFGLLPALQATRVDLRNALQEGGRSATGGGRGGRVRNLLVASEVALALVLLTGAGLLIKSLYRLQQVSPGFQTEQVLTMLVPLPQTKYPQPERVLAFYQEATARIAQLPGVVAVGATSCLPYGGGGWNKNLSIEGRPPAASMEQVPSVSYRHITPDYFRALGVPLRAGRYFAESDAAQAPSVAIVNEAIVEQFFPNENPIGKVIRMGPPEHLVGWLARPLTIVGVVGDVRNWGLNQPVLTEVFIPHAQGADDPQRTMYLAVKTSSDPMNLANAVRDQIRAMDKELPVTGIATMEQRLGESLGEARFNTFLLAIFAAVALVLAAIGIYGVVSYSVTQRTHEIGIRMALGAPVSSILKLVLGHSLAITLLGVIAGLAGAWGLTRFLDSLLFGVSPTDTVIFCGMPLLLVVIAMLASYLSARRATKVDPVTALRRE
jgi:putative ABC transport system permease protein